MSKARNIQTPGETAQTANEGDGEELGEVSVGSGDKVPTGNDSAGDDVEALKAQLAALQAENANLKAKPAKAPVKGPTTSAQGHELTAGGWIVKEPAPPVKG